MGRWLRIGAAVNASAKLQALADGARLASSRLWGANLNLLVPAATRAIFAVGAEALVEVLSDAHLVLAGPSATRALSWALPDGSWPVEANVPEPAFVDVVERCVLEPDPAGDLVLREPAPGSARRRCGTRAAASQNSAPRAPAASPVALPATDMVPAMANHLRVELGSAALEMALQTRRPKPGLIHHTDRGVQAGFKGSSQHLQRRCDGSTKATTVGSGAASADALTGSSTGSTSRGPAALLGSHRRGADE